jgi:hypothetical protein
MSRTLDLYYVENGEIFRITWSAAKVLEWTYDRRKEHGAFMAAALLNSPRAVDMSVYVVRAFVKLRQTLASHTELARKLDILEKSLATLDARTRRQFEEVYAAIRALMAPPAVKSRPIGFTADLDKDR